MAGLARLRAHQHGRAAGAVGDRPFLVPELSGRYSILSQCGRGGQARVLVAFDAALDCEVALKETLEPVADANAPAAVRFLREGRITGQLSHPGIVPIHEMGRRPDGRLYYTMKLVRGGTLARAIAARASVRERLGLLSNFLSLCQAVAFAHSRGVLHRDIKPQNVMVGEFGETVLLDWGLATNKLAGFTPPAADAVQDAAAVAAPAPATAVGARVGTPAYMSPEQARGDMAELDERSDVFGLGAVLYEILSGWPPWQAPSSHRRYSGAAEQDEPPPPLRSLGPDVPPELASIAHKAIAIAKDDRYQNAAALAEDIQRYLLGDRVLAHNYGLVEGVRWFARRHRFALLALSGVAIAVIVAFTAITAALRVAQAERHNAEVAAANTQVEASRAAVIAGESLETRARLRMALEVSDSPEARVLWRRVARQPMRWQARLYESVQALTYMTAGARLAAVASNGNVHLLDTETGRGDLWRMGVQQLTAVAASGGDRFLAVGGGAKGEIAIWSRPQTPLGAPTRTFTCGAMVMSLTFAPIGRPVDGSAQEWLVAACGTAGVHVIDPETAQETLVVPAPLTWAAAVSPDGRTIATTTGDGVALHDARSGERIAGLREDAVKFVSLSFAGDSSWLAAGGEDGLIRVWRVSDHSLAHRLRGHTRTVNSLAADPQNPRRLASASRDGTLRLWDVEREQTLAQFRGGKSGFLALAIAPDGRSLAAGDFTADAVDLFDLDVETSSVGLEKVVEPQLAVAFSPDGTLIASGGKDNAVHLWDANTGAQVALLEGHDAPVLDLDFGPDGALLASVGDDARVRLWNVGARSARAVWPGLQYLRATRFLPDGKVLVTGGQRSLIHFWDVETGELQRTIGPLAERVFGLAVSRDGTMVASSGFDGAVRVWSTTRGAELRAFADVGRWGLSFSPDGRLLAVGGGGSDASVYVFDLRTGGRSVLGSGNESVGRVAFSADGTRVGFGHSIITLGTGAALTMGPGGAADGFAFSPLMATGHLRAATTADDASVRLWDAENGRPLWYTTAVLAEEGEALTHRGWVRIRDGVAIDPPPTAWRLAVAKDTAISGSARGDLLCILDNDGTLALWSMSKDAELSHFKSSPAAQLLATRTGCLTLADTSARLFLANGDTRQLDSGVVALGASSVDELVLLAYQDRVRVIDTDGTEKGIVHTGAPATAVQWIDGMVAAGFADGGIQLSPFDPASRAESKRMVAPLAGAALQIAKGPPGTIVGASANGDIALWSTTTGARLDGIALHGPVTFLTVAGGHVLAATDVGQVADWDLNVLSDPYCDILQDVWRRTPVVWQAGTPVKRAPPAAHVCAAVERGDGPVRMGGAP